MTQTEPIDAATKSRTCRLCESHSVTAIRSMASPHMDVRFTLYACGKCGSRFFDPQEHPTDLEAIYDGLAAERDLNKAFQPDPFWTKEVERIQATHAGEITRVLDVGCREGNFLMHWPPSIHRCGVELSGHAAGIARSRGLTIQQEPLETATLEHAFDVVGSYAILEHLTQPAPFLARLSDLVAPGGILVILIPSFETLKARLLTSIRYPWHMYSPPEHLNFFSRDFLDNTLSQRGLELKDRTYSSGGMANPFKKIPLIGKAWGRGVATLDRSSALRKRALFDHMYSTYQRKS